MVVRTGLERLRGEGSKEYERNKEEMELGSWRQKYCGAVVPTTAVVVASKVEA